MDTEQDDPSRDTIRSPRIMRLLEANGRVAWQLVGILLAIGLFAFVFSRLKLILLAVFVGLVVAAIIEPVAAWLEARGLGRRVATSIGLVLVVTTLTGVAAVVGYRMVDELPGVVENVQERRTVLLDVLSREPLSLTEDELQELLDRGMATMGSNSVPDADPVDGTAGGSEVGASGATAATGADQPGSQEESADDGEGPSPDTTFQLLMVSAAGLSILGFALVGLVLSFFLVRDRDRIVDGVVHQLAGGDHDRSARRVLAAAWRALDGYVRASVVVGALEGSLIGVALVIVGTPLAGALAFITFVGAFIPVVGATVSGLLAVGVTWLAVGEIEAIVIAIVVLLVQQFDGNVLQPTIVAANTHLHPIATILALLVGGLVGGLLGALLAVPTTAVVVAVADELLTPAPA